MTCLSDDQIQSVTPDVSWRRDMLYQVMHGKHIMKFGASGGSSVVNMDIEVSNYDPWRRKERSTFEEIAEVVEARIRDDFRASWSVDDDDDGVETGALYVDAEDFKRRINWQTNRSNV